MLNPSSCLRVLFNISSVINKSHCQTRATLSWLLWSCFFQPHLCRGESDRTEGQMHSILPCHSMLMDQHSERLTAPLDTNLLVGTFWACVLSKHIDVMLCVSTTNTTRHNLCVQFNLFSFPPTLKPSTLLLLTRALVSHLFFGSFMMFKVLQKPALSERCREALDLTKAFVGVL